MEKRRWVLIFSALCLALAFSVSPVEAQQSCDRDGDGWFKDTNKCDGMAEFGPDPNDNDCAIPDPDACGGGGGGGDGGGGGKSIPLIVTFRDCNEGEPADVWPPDEKGCELVDPDGMVTLITDGIQSDGWGSYADKEDRVVAAINKNGRFRLGVAQNSPSPPIRKLFYSFICSDDPGDPDCTLPPPKLFPAGEGFSIGAVNWYTSGVDLRNMTVDPEIVDPDLGLSAGLSLANEDAGNWRILFGFNPLDLDCQGSHTITVTHPDDNTWVIEAGPDAKACLALLDPGGVGTGESMGLYHMPFQIVLKKKF